MRRKQQKVEDDRVGLDDQPKPLPAADVDQPELLADEARQDHGGESGRHARECGLRKNIGRRRRRDG